MASPLQLAALAAVVPAARAAMSEWGVPASVTLAQWTLESAWGTSELAEECHNFFGIKVQPGQDYEEFPTHEVVRGRTVVEMADFVWYPSAAAGFDAHARFLAKLPRYAPAMRVRQDVPSFCAQLQHCGYSTSPTYARDLLTLIHEHNLCQHDQPAPPAVATAKA